MMKYLVVVSLLIMGCNYVPSDRKATTQRLSDTLQVPQKEESKPIFDNDTIAIYKIDSVEFFQQRSTAKVETDTLPSISDFAKAREMLRGRVVFGGWNDEKRIVDSAIEGIQLVEVRFARADTIVSKGMNGWWDSGFVKYFPTEDIILMEGGHSSDMSIDLRHELIDVEVVGNPDYIVRSTTGAYRLNGWFPGQECSSYFLQKKSGDRYEYLTEIPIHLTAEGFDLCTISSIFWQSDQELYFRNIYYGFTDDKRLGFFKLVIR